MATKAALPSVLMTGAMHTAGIFSDMTVDGPEIGTLVLVIDRAKNLPNRKSMGKQNPYCAARLGKEAKKTETDKRGGQTPRWDQELRFTVHESPDYNNLKLSVFSEDKRTELIGEAWLSLAEVVVPGGGKNDIWQTLNCKGKYAGEIRIELTYYDSRPKPERSAEDQSLLQSAGSAKVKRRPLPTNSISGSTDNLGAPLRAKHGPREYGTPPRALSMPSEAIAPAPAQPSPQPEPNAARPHCYASMPQMAPESILAEQQYQEEHHQALPQHNDPYQHPDFLPRLPPTSRQRSVRPPATPGLDHLAPSEMRPYTHAGLHHSYSAPDVSPLHPEELEQHDGGYQVRTDFPEPIADLDYQYEQIRPRRNSATLVGEQPNTSMYARQRRDFDDENAAPPPPPLHAHSSPAVSQQYASPHRYQQPSPTPRYSQTPPEPRQQYPYAPLVQSTDRDYATPAVQHPGPSRSYDDYMPSPDNDGYGSTPPALSPGQSPSSYGRSLVGRSVQTAARYSAADTHYNTPPRPHPLSQELPRSHSRQPYPNLVGSLPYGDGEVAYHSDSRKSIMVPRAVSPRPAQPIQQPERRPKSSYSLQFPVRAFELSDNSPLSSSTQRTPQPPHASSVARKSVSPRPSITTASAVPFGPDSFDVHNPHARSATLPSSNSPHSPYQISPDAEHHSDQRGPIVGWHGQEIDPSDHLPVDSWAPEPEKKTPTKTYGFGRDRDFGPRSTNGMSDTNGRIGKDTVINVRMKPSTEYQSSSTSRNRLAKKSGTNSSGSSPVEFARDHHRFSSVPDPYSQPEFSQRGLGTYGGRGYEMDGDHPPSLPPKVPADYHGDTDALQRELANIDIGSSHHHQRAGSVPTPASYVPVRSQRDRQSYY